MSLKESAGNAATVTAINSSVVGAAGWVNENYQLLMFGIAAVSFLMSAILGTLNHLEKRKVTDHLVNGD